MRQQHKRYFQAITKRPNFSTLDTEVSDEILLSEKEKHEKKLSFGNEDALLKNSLRSKKMSYSFSII